MKFLLILLCIATTQAGVIKDECTGIKINGIYHENETLHTGLDRPYLLAVDYSTNILFFSYSITESEDGFKTASINLNTKEFKDIKVENGFAQTVDQDNHDIYIGGSDGIYKYNYGDDKAELIGENVKGLNIWNLYYKDVLYYSVYPSQFLYTYIDGTSTRFKDLEDTKVDNIVIDNEEVIFFTNATGLYSQKKGTKDSVFYQEHPRIGVRGLATDINGKVYVCLQDGIYVTNKETVTLEKVVDLDDAFGVAFDNDNNMIVSDATSLIRFKQVKHKRC